MFVSLSTATLIFATITVYAVPQGGAFLGADGTPIPFNVNLQTFTETANGNAALGCRLLGNGKIHRAGGGDFDNPTDCLVS